MMVVGEEVEVEEEDKEERLYDAMFFFRAILAMEIFANVDNLMIVYVLEILRSDEMEGGAIRKRYRQMR